MGKKILKIALIVLGVVVVLAVAFVLYLTLAEYKPADVEAVETLSYGDAETPGSGITLMTWNIGYCGLGANEDFVMDGGAGSGKPEQYILRRRARHAQGARGGRISHAGGGLGQRAQLSRG